MTRRLGRSAAAVCTVVSGVVTSACSLSPDETRADTESVEVGVAAEPNSVVDWDALPLTGQMMNTPFDQMKRWAHEGSEHSRLPLKQCLQDAGFSAEVLLEPDPTPYVIGISPRALNLEQAQARGLRIVEMQDAYEAMPPAAADLQQPPEADPAGQEQALHACRDQLSTPMVEAITQLADSYVVALNENATILAAHKAWRSCMAGHGHDVSSVTELTASIRQSFAMPTDQNADAFSQELARRRDVTWEMEREAARAQVMCDGQELAPVIDEWARVESEWMDTNADALGELPMFSRFEVLAMVDGRW